LSEAEAVLSGEWDRKTDFRRPLNFFWLGDGMGETALLLADPDAAVLAGD